MLKPVRNFIREPWQLFAAIALFIWVAVAKESSGQFQALGSANGVVDLSLAAAGSLLIILRLWFGNTQVGRELADEGVQLPGRSVLLINCLLMALLPLLMGQHEKFAAMAGLIMAVNCGWLIHLNFVLTGAIEHRLRGGFDLGGLEGLRRIVRFWLCNNLGCLVLGLIAFPIFSGTASWPTAALAVLVANGVIDFVVARPVYTPAFSSR